MGLNVAIIPARGGSKRLPNKNILSLAGKPLVVWSINAAIESGVFDRVYVSTDSVKISEAAIEAGASVPFLRPLELAADNTSTEDVVSHMVNWVESNEGHVDSICILQPTSPLRSSEHIIEARRMFEAKGASSVVSVCKVEHPVEWTNIIDSNTLSLDGFLTLENMKRSQDFPVRYRLNGAIYMINRSVVGMFKNLYGDNSFAYIMDTDVSVDIDTKIDFMLAESMIEERELKTENEI